MRYFLTWHSWLFIIATLLALLLVAVIYPIVSSHRKKTNFWSQNLLFTRVFSGISLVGLAMLIAALITPYVISVKHQPIQLKTANNFSIAVISDPQVSPLKRASFINRVVDKITKEQPDAVFLVGDLINNEVPLADEIKHLEPISDLAKDIPIYAVLGNHEYGVSNPELPPLHPDAHTKVEKELERLGVTLLKNELTTIFRDEEPILEFYGFDDLWNPDFQMPILPPKTVLPRIALSHNPDAVYLVDKTTANMVVSGHTHGGQIRIPLIGAFIHAGTKLPKKFYKGLSEHNGIPLYVTSGLGESGPPVRLFNMPEIVVLDL